MAKIYNVPTTTNRELHFHIKEKKAPRHIRLRKMSSLFLLRKDKKKNYWRLKEIGKKWNKSFYVSFRDCWSWTHKNFSFGHVESSRSGGEINKN